MPVGDFPTIPHDNCILIVNRTVTSKMALYTHIYALYILHICTCKFILDVSKRGVLDRRMTILHFSAYSVNFSDHVVFADHGHVFLANTCIFYIFKIRYCIFLHIMPLFIVHGKICLQFTCIFCIFAVHRKDGTVENAPNILQF